MEWKHEAPHMVIIKFLSYKRHRYKTHTYTDTHLKYMSLLLCCLPFHKISFPKKIYIIRKLNLFCVSHVGKSKALGKKTW